jgi:surface antigen
MKKIVSTLVIGTVAFNLSSCSNWSKADVGTATGAVGGAAIGGLLFHGDSQIPAMIVGGILGGTIGNRIGNQMDEQDRARMSQAIIRTPTHQTAAWTNPDTGITYQVTPIRTYQTTQHRYCREYQTTVIINGEAQKAYGTACRQPDGSWKIVK